MGSGYATLAILTGAHRDPCSFAVWFERHVGETQYMRLAELHNIVFKNTIEDLQEILRMLEENNA